jgi:hypothetical protein
MIVALSGCEAGQRIYEEHYQDRKDNKNCSFHKHLLLREAFLLLLKNLDPLLIHIITR